MMQTLLTKTKLPPFALVNNMHVRAIPPELSCLNNMEKRLISCVQPFMKLVVLPYGQQALKGQTINFPINASEICQSLPKTLDDDGIVLIAPPRAEQADISEGQALFSVQRPLLIRALHELKEDDRLYRDRSDGVEKLPLQRN